MIDVTLFQLFFEFGDTTWKINYFKFSKRKVKSNIRKMKILNKRKD